jgi:hypothetical protein
VSEPPFDLDGFLGEIVDGLPVRSEKPVTGLARRILGEKIERAARDQNQKDRIARATTKPLGYTAQQEEAAAKKIILPPGAKT